MAKIKIWMTIVWAAPLFLAADAMSIKEGEKLYMSKGCYGCHGTVGEGIGDYPKLAGRSAKELAHKLYQLQKGIGHTSKRQMMIPFAKALTKEEIAKITAFLSSPKEEENLETPEEILGGSDM